MPNEMKVTQESVAGIRALAHPLRLELLDLLRFDGPSTATALGRRVGESSGATSYHLRQLARYGLIEEEPRAGGRERWWRYRERRVSIGGDGSARKLVSELLSREAHALDHFLAETGRPAEWEEAAFFQSRALWITAEELTELRRGIEELMAPLRRADADRSDAETDDWPPDARRVRVLVFGFPVAGQES